MEEVCAGAVEAGVDEALPVEDAGGVDELCVEAFDAGGVDGEDAGADDAVCVDPLWAAEPEVEAGAEDDEPAAGADDDEELPDVDGE